MSYQLISAGQPAGKEGFRVIAHSPHMPAAIQVPLAEMARSAMNGDTFYSYRVVQLLGETYHLLTAGSARISPVEQRLAHQLLLTDAEVTGLQQSTARPTPAGLILAFVRNRYWAKSEAEIPDLEGEPKVSGGDLPDASEQKKWKELTGHKNDVRVFLTAPFDTQCLAFFPAICTIENILELLHESQWLMPDRGWGQTFRVSNVLPAEGDFSHFRIVATNALPPEENHYQGIPVLRISHQTQQLEAPAPAIRSAKTGEHYQYTECPDWDIFDIPPPGSGFVKRCFLILSCVTALVAAGIVAYLIADNSANEDKNTVQTIEQQFFNAICNAEESQDTQLKELESELRKLNTAKSVAMLECIRIFTEDSMECGGHPNNMLSLLQQAGIIGINGEELCLSYLNKVIISYRAEDWVRENSTAEELVEWKQLFSQSPTLKTKIKQASAYRAFMHDLIRLTENNSMQLY